MQSSQKELTDISREKLRLSQSILARRDYGQVMLGIQQEQESAKQSIVSLQRRYQELEWEREKGRGQKEQLETNSMVSPVESVLSAV